MWARRFAPCYGVGGSPGSVSQPVSASCSSSSSTTQTMMAWRGQPSAQSLLSRECNAPACRSSYPRWSHVVSSSWSKKVARVGPLAIASHRSYGPLGRPPLRRSYGPLRMPYRRVGYGLLSSPEGRTTHGTRSAVAVRALPGARRSLRSLTMIDIRPLRIMGAIGQLAGRCLPGEGAQTGHLESEMLQRRRPENRHHRRVGARRTSLPRGIAS